MRTFMFAMLAAIGLAVTADNADARPWRGYYGYSYSYPAYSAGYYYSTPVYPSTYVVPASYYSTYPTSSYYYPTSSYYTSYPSSYYYSYPNYRVGRWGRWRW